MGVSMYSLTESEGLSFCIGMYVTQQRLLCGEWMRRNVKSKSPVRWNQIRIEIEVCVVIRPPHLNVSLVREVKRVTVLANFLPEDEW